MTAALQLFPSDTLAEELSDIDVDPASVLLSPETTHLDLTAEERQRAMRGDLLSLGRSLKNIKATRSALEAHVAEIQAKLEALNVRESYLKGYAGVLFEQLGTENVKDPFVTVYRQKNPTSVEVLDEAVVPRRYKRVTITLPVGRPAPEWLRQYAAEQVMKSAIIDDFNETGEVPEGVAVNASSKGVRVR